MKVNKKWWVVARNEGRLCRMCHEPVTKYDWKEYDHLCGQCYRREVNIQHHPPTKATIDEQNDDRMMANYGEPIMTLDCKCGDTITGSNDKLYASGWRFLRTRKGVNYLCPKCLEKRRNY